MDGEMNYSMTENYKECLEKGLKYQDFVTDIIFEKKAITLSAYSSREYQFTKGETKQGFEIKFDDKFEKTGNLYIETSEKTNPKNANFVKSGIYRDDNTWIWLIGNYKEIFIFSPKYLRKIHKKKNYREINTLTSTGFLIPKKDIENYCLEKIIVE